MEAAVQTLQAQAAELQQRVIFAESSNDKSARLLDDSRNGVKKLEAISQRADFSAKWHLVDFNTMTPEVFANKSNQSFKTWAKTTKAFTNAKFTGFRSALDWAERESDLIDPSARAAQNWGPWRPQAPGCTTCSSFSRPMTRSSSSNHIGEGFETWRQQAKRYDPTGDIFAFDCMSALMSRPRCNNINELGSAIEKWMRDMQRYQAKTGETLPGKWKVLIASPSGVPPTLSGPWT